MEEDASLSKINSRPYGGSNVTEVVSGARATSSIVGEAVARATRSISAVQEPMAPTVDAEGPLKELLKEATLRGVKVRFITEITSSNMGYYSSMMGLSVELRHLDHIRGNFTVTENDYLRGTTRANDLGVVPEVIHSNIPEVVEESQFMFEMLWDKAVPADFRIKQLQERHETGETRYTFSSQEIYESANRFVDGMREEALVFVPMENGIKETPQFFERLASRAEAVGAKVRILVRFSKDELDLIRGLQQRGIEFRRPASRERFNLAIGIYDRKGMGLVEDVHQVSAQTRGRHISGVISTDRQMVEWVAAVFEMFWESAVPIEDAIAEVETGIEPSRLHVFRDRSRVREILLQQISRSREEVLLLLPTIKAFHREEAICTIDAIEKALERGVRVKILTPLDSSIEGTLMAMRGQSSMKFSRMNYRPIPEAIIPHTVTILVVDRIASLVVEQKDDSQSEFEKAIGDATYSTRNSTVFANIRFFERTWEEVDLRAKLETALQKERASRMAAELLQDILAHDIRNYNQVSKLSAELLRRNLSGSIEVLKELRDVLNLVDSSSPDPASDISVRARRLGGGVSENIKTLIESDLLVGAIVKATEGSGNLTDRAKKLGKIMAQEELKLGPVDLHGAILRSVTLVSAAHPDRSITPFYSIKPGVRVIADEMLDEVFTNILSNSINHTEGTAVPIEISVEETTLDGKSNPYLKISISDRGRGIPDMIKERVFTRYLKAASGTGLGLSIVYALAVERYSGKVKVSDRVEGDHTQGTKIELWLLQAR